MTKKKQWEKTYSVVTEPCSKINDLFVRLVRVIPERSVAGVVPEFELEVTKAGLHPCLELISIDVLVQSAVQHEIRESFGGIHQSGFVLDMWDAPIPDIWMLTSDGTHPAVFSCLVQFVTVSHAGLGEFLYGGSEICERWIQQFRNKVDDVGGSDLRVHVTMRE